MQVDFVKMEGAGNDFIMIDGRGGTFLDGDMGAFAAKYGPRKRGIGADGIIVLLPAAEEEHDFRMRFFNPDGSEAEMCGNGARCIALFAHGLGVAGRSMRFSTAAGPIEAEMTEGGVKLHMTPAPAIQEVPGLAVADRTVDILYTNTGVPHAVIPVDNIETVDVGGLGTAIRYHDRFRPAGTNVDFIVRTGENTVSLRTYERGVEDETLACGTGACAAALAASHAFGMSSPVAVRTRGGDILTIYFTAAVDGSYPELYLEGPAKEVFRGSAPW
ncbi:MAG: diaminopimelate epimerase [Planctomycetes bacterium]|nr:diaminopimelate epimerase [Planctomycetota bacterium]